MKASESSSASTSAATSTNGHSPKGEPKKVSEAELLTNEAADASKAMAAAWADLKQSMGSSVDVRKWTGRYPWIAAGTVLVAGVAAGYLLTPRDKDEAAELWAKLKAKVAGEKADPNTVYVEPTTGKPQQAPEKPSLLSTILREASKSLMPLVTSMLGAALGGGEAAQHAEEQAADGHPRA